MAITTTTLGVFRKVKDFVIKSSGKAMPLDEQILWQRFDFERHRFTAYCKSAQQLLGDTENIEDHPLAQFMSMVSSVLVGIRDELRLSWWETKMAGVVEKGKRYDRFRELVREATILNNCLKEHIEEVKEEMEKNKNKGQDKEDLATTASVDQLSQKVELNQEKVEYTIQILHEADTNAASEVLKLESKIEEMEKVIAEIRKQLEEKK